MRLKQLLTEVFTEVFLNTGRRETGWANRKLQSDKRLLNLKRQNILCNIFIYYKYFPGIR